MNDDRKQRPNLIVPVGTQVVTRAETRAAGHTFPAGTVGEVIKAPPDASHSYRVRFPDGTETALRRSEFSILKHAKGGPIGNPAGVLEEHNLYDYVIYRCVVGSVAYGLAGEESDVDRRGIYLPPADLQWSLYGVPEQLESPETEEVYWELQKFLNLALKANPNVLECLYTPLVQFKTGLAEELIGMREIFLSRLIYQTYNGYVLSQFKKLEQDLRATGEIRWKHAMHLIRLLLSGITALREGFVPVSVVENRAQLLAIRAAEMPWEEVNAWRLLLHREFERAFTATRLPERPNYERANRFLIEARRSMVEAT